MTCWDAMPMQRKRPREPSERFHYLFLERYDLFQMSGMFLLSACVLLLLGDQAKKGINPEEIVLSILLDELKIIDKSNWRIL